MIAEAPKMSSASSSASGAILVDNGIRKTEEANKRDFRLDVLVAIFGMSSWISVNGLWVQLPVIVNEYVSKIVNIKTNVESIFFIVAGFQSTMT